jgi:hypothetical protein
MTDRTTLLALAERCEQAGGPDDSLDFGIALAAGYRFEMREYEKRKRWRDPKGIRCSALTADGIPPHFTASLDAVVTLYPVLPEVIPSCPRKASAAALRARVALGEKG